MTLIAGFVEGGVVTLLGDSVAGNVSQYTVDLVTEPKVFFVQDLLIGYTTSFRMGQLLQHGLDLPARNRALDAGTWLRTIFATRVRALFEGNGFGDGKNDNGGVFLIGVDGRLFTMQGDFAVLEYTHPYAAVGCGESYAEGALHALGTLRRSGGTEHTPREMLRLAADAATRHSAYVRPPYHLIRSDQPGVVEVIRP